MGRIHKVMLAVINYDHPQRGMLHAFRSLFGDQNVLNFDYLELQRQGVSVGTINDRFVAEALRFKPDWIWLQLQETGVITAEAIGQVNSKLPAVITHWTGDCRESVTPYLASICQATHFTFVSNEGQRPAFQQAGTRRFRYVQIGLDWHEDVLGLPEWEPPFRVPAVVFCGNFYGEAFPGGSRERLAAIRALRDADVDVAVVGDHWPSDIPVAGCCKVKQQHHVWRRARIALNVNHFNGIRKYYSDRQLIAMASGTPVVCSYVPGIEEEFKADKHCAWFHDTSQLVGKTKRLLDDPVFAGAIGIHGRAEVIRNHTWFSRILAVLPDVELMRGQIRR